MSEKNSSFIEHTAIILPGLIIGYFLLITSPPSDLLRYNENLKIATTYHLSGSEILNHFGSISIFIALFFLISIFLTFVAKRILKRKKLKFVGADVVLIIVSMIMLGLVAFPYYGFPLTVIMYSTGLIGGHSALLLYHSYIRLEYPTLFCRYALYFYLCMWAIADMEPSPVWFSGFFGLFIIGTVSKKLGKIPKKRKRG